MKTRRVEPSSPKKSIKKPRVNNSLQIKKPINWTFAVALNPYIKFNLTKINSNTPSEDFEISFFIDNFSEFELLFFSKDKLPPGCDTNDFFLVKALEKNSLRLVEYVEDYRPSSNKSDEQRILVLDASPSHPRRALFLLKSIRNFIEVKRLQPHPSLLQNLDSAIACCAEKILSKPHVKPAKYSANISEFQKELSSNLPVSRNSAYEATKIPAGGKFIVKETGTGKGSAITEYEALSAEWCRLLLGPDRHPEVHVLYNDDGERVGVASEKINFVSMLDNRINAKCNKNTFLTNKIGNTIAANFIICENDGHFGNLGIKGEKIDGDQSLWPLTHKYFDANCGKSFDINEKVLRLFPRLPIPPQHWITDKHTSQHTLGFDPQELSSDQQAKEQFFYTFLKQILIPDEVFVALSQGFMSTAKRQKRILDFMRTRTQQLKQNLLKVPEFVEYIGKNPNVINQITNEFQAYNTRLSPMKQPDLSVDINKVRNEFKSIDKSIQINFTKCTILKELAALLNKIDDKKLTSAMKKVKHIITSDKYGDHLLLKWDAVQKQCKKHAAGGSIAGWVKNRLVLSRLSTRSDENDLVYRAIANFESNYKFNPEITNLKNVILAQQKCDVRDKLYKKIQRLRMPKIVTASQGQVYSVKCDIAERKALILEQYANSLLSKANRNAEVADCLQAPTVADVSAGLASKRGLFASSTSAKMLIKLNNTSKKSADIIRKIGNKRSIH